MKYKRLLADLERDGEGRMKVFGNSMLPRIKSGSTLTFQRASSYEVGDVVFCKVRGRYIDAHLVVQKDDRDRCLIANNHGHQNGWTDQVYGKVIKIEPAR